MWNTVQDVRTIFEEENRYIYIPDLQPKAFVAVTPLSVTL